MNELIILLVFSFASFEFNISSLHPTFYFLFSLFIHKDIHTYILLIIILRMSRKNDQTNSPEQASKFSLFCFRFPLVSPLFFFF